jgi:hypothetical protein
MGVIGKTKKNLVIIEKAPRGYMGTCILFRIVK